MLDSVFLQISLLLGLTITVAFFVRLLRQPMMVAYLIAGIVAGPFFLNILQGEVETFHALSEFGVVLLLFVVGLSLNFDHIKQIGKVAVVVGLTQVVFTAGIGYVILAGLGYPPVSALFLSLAMTFSSTIIIVKLLAEKKDTDSLYGRYVFGLMIVQDLVAILIMIIITSLGEGGSLSTLLASLVVKTILLGALVFLLGRYAIPFILRKIAKSSEFLFIFTLAWCFGIATLLHWLGFSIEIGAIMAGLTLGSSPYQSEISSRIKPVRDFFIVIFFIILGSELSLANMDAVIVPGLILSAFILLGNPFILYLMFRLQKFTRRNSFFAGVTAAQVSEFGFVLLLTATGLGYINGSELEVFTLVALTTIIGSSYLVIYNKTVFGLLKPFFHLFGPDRHRQTDNKPPSYDVWVFGYHRIGWKVCESLAEAGKTFAVVDYNPEAIEKLKARNIPAYFGDAADVEFLESMGLQKAKMIVSTIPDSDDQITLIRHIRQTNSRAIVIANLNHNRSLSEVYKAGADYVMLPHLLAGEWMNHVFLHKPWTKKTYRDLKKAQKQEMQLRFTMGTHDV